MDCVMLNFMTAGWCAEIVPYFISALCRQLPRVGITSRCGNERASAAARDVLNARRAGTVVNGREAAVISARERSARAVPDDAWNCRTECGVQNTTGVRSQSTVADQCASPTRTL